MVNTIRKGNCFENEIEKELIAGGWTIIFRAKRAKFQKVDFGPVPLEKAKTAKVDIMAVKKICQNPDQSTTYNLRRLAISAKNHANTQSFPKHEEELGRWWKEYLPEWNVELWAKKKAGWRGPGKNKHFEPTRVIKTKIREVD